MMSLARVPITVGAGLRCVRTKHLQMSLYLLYGPQPDLRLLAASVAAVGVGSDQRKLKVTVVFP